MRFRVPFIFGLVCAAITLPGQPHSGVEVSPLSRLRSGQPGDNQAVTARGIVTTPSGWKTSFFLQDATGSISVDRLDSAEVRSGDEVQVTGRLHAGLFAPLLVSDRVEVIRRGVALPAAQSPPYAELASGRFDSVLVAVAGVVQTATLETVWGRQVLRLRVRVGEGTILVHLVDYAGISVESLVDSLIRVRGVCGTVFNDRRQIIGVRLFVPNASQIRVEVPAANRARVELSQISQVQQYSQAGDTQHRIRVIGTLTYQSQDHGLYLEDSGGAIHVKTGTKEAFRLGDQIEAIGFLHSFGYSPGLENAQARRVGSAEAIEARTVEASSLITNREDFPSTAYDGRLVRLKARVLEQIPNSRNQVWLLQRGRTNFQAELSGVASTGRPVFEPSSEVEVVGICASVLDENGSPSSFRILLRSAKDIVIRDSPSSQHALLILLAGMAILLGSGVALWKFDTVHSGGSAIGAHPRKILARFERGSRILCWPIFPCSVYLFVRAPLPVDRYAAGLLGLGALAWLWHQDRIVWRDRCSLLCALLVMASGIAELSLGGNIPVATGFCFAFLGLGQLMLRHERVSWFAQLLLLSVVTVSLLNFVALLYGASASYSLARHTRIVPALALGFCCLSMAGLFLRPAAGLMQAVSSARIGGQVSRRLLPAAVFLPVFLGWVRWQGQMVGLYDTVFGLAIFAVSNILSFGCIVWISSAVLNRLDAARSRGEEALRERDRNLELLFEKSGIGEYYWDVERDMVRFNATVDKFYGGTGAQNQAPAAWFRERMHAEDAERVQTEVQLAIAQRTPLDVEFRVNQPDGKVRWISCRGNVVYDDQGAPSHINGLNIDLTARKESEAAVRTSLESARLADHQLNTGLELSKVAVWQWFSEVDKVTWSGPVEEIYGSSAEQLSRYAGLRELIHPDDRDDLDAVVQEALSKGCDYRADFRVLAGDEIRWIAGRGAALRDASGAICGMSGVNFDVTATKQAEQRMFESERRFRLLADAMPQIVWTSNASGQLDYCNGQWQLYTGNVWASQISEFLHPDDLADWNRQWQRSVSERSWFSCEMRLKRGLDGSYRWHLSRALPIRNGEGEITQWYGTSTDIDDYKRAQAEIESLNSNLEGIIRERSAQLAESELRHRLLVESVKDYAIFVLDAQGHVKSWNQGAEHLTGYKASAILGQHFGMFLNAGARMSGVAEISLRDASRDGRSNLEGWLLRQDGSEFWAQVVTTPLFDADGRLRGFSKIIRDMTEQRRVESLLIAERKRAESASEAKSAFLASMSHEIRTPMNAILGMADMLWESELSQTQRHYVEIFRRAGGSLLTLINDILDLSKIESGNFSLEQIDFDVTAVVEQVVEILSPKAVAKGLSLHARLAFASAPVVVGDPLRLQQILLNLIGNAIKFTNAGEVVVRVECQSHGAYATLAFDVSDTGIGIADEKLESIFEDFEQGESSTTRRFGGTGLGLGISRRLVRLMRGEIRARSELGKGSAFSFDVSLPFGLDQKTQASPHMEEISGKRVLIVDNNPTNRIILGEMCLAWGMLVSLCCSGSEAVEVTHAAFDERRFDLALVDRMMPGMDGFETAAELKRLDPSVDVFIVSSDSQAGDVARCREMGLAGHLLKPVRRAELLEQIVKSLSHSPLESLDRGTAQPPPKSIQANSKKARILVAEDSEDNRFLLQAYCQGSRYELTFVEDGERAVKAYEAGEFEMIVMDVQMPVMDGLTATRAIRTIEGERQCQQTPIVALTANALPQDIVSARTAGCDAHLAKPISKKAFLSGLEQWLPAAAKGIPGVIRIDIPQGLEDLAPKYLENRQSEIVLLRELLEKADFEKLQRLSHNLKGTGAGYGFPDISKLGGDIESAAKDCDAIAIAGHLAALANYLEAAKECIVVTA